MHGHMDREATHRNSGRPSSSAKPRKSLELLWEKAYGRPPPAGISTVLLVRATDYDAQTRQFGELPRSIEKALHALADGSSGAPFPKSKMTFKPGVRLAREWHGKTHIIDIGKSGVVYRGKTYRSLSEVARVITGTRWSGPRFFGI